MAENSVRMSQLVGTFGPGAMLDLPDRSVLVLGIDQWEMQGKGTFQKIEEPRLQRLLHAGWLTPVKRESRKVLFRARDVRAAIAKLERLAVPPDRIRVAEVRASERRTGRGYVPKPRKPRPGPLDFVIDLNGF